MNSPMRYIKQIVYFVFLAGFMLRAPVHAQDVLGGITGTVKDATGAAVPDVTVHARNIGTNLEVVQHTQSNGSYSVGNIPVGAYIVTFTKDGFETETHTQVLVDANRTTTVDGDLKVGTVATTVEVTATPLMNQVDTTNGYVVDQLTIEQTPLGTGSFTQLAILSPGVHADMLGGAGSNAGLGNQAIFANGNRDTSNSFTLNGVDTNNLFNGNSTSQVGENRFVLNIGENFGAGGAIQTSTSVYGAIGQALPTPPTETIQEISVNAAMYDATQGAHSGAHISVITKSGTNAVHGMLYEDFQNSVFNAAPFFYNASPAIITKDPFLNRNQFGVNLGGPIKKNKLFYFVAYQGVRIADAADATKDVDVPIGLTNDRSLQGIVNAMQTSYGKTITTSQVSPVAAAMLQATLPNGQYLFPSAQITNSKTANALGYDAVVEGPNAQSSVNQGIGNIDYNVSDMDRLTGKFYYQTDPTTNPFGAVGALLGFPQQLQAGSQVGAINNTVILSPSLTWQQHVGFTRLQAYSQTQQQFTPGDFGMSLLGATNFPQIEISDALGSNGLEFGPSVSFGNAGMYQNQWELGSTLNWIKGRHTIAIGGSWAHTQLNIINNNTESDTLGFKSFLNFVEGVVRTGSDSAAFPDANASRYYRSNTAGIFVNDNYKVASNLSLTLGLRWDFDGPLTEKYGRLATFNPSLYGYDASTDTITSSGLEVAANNATLGTAGANDSLLTQHQWGLAPRIGLAWTPKPKFTVRTGFGMYYDRGELFSEFSPSAGFGFNGPLGVTLEQPFVTAIFAGKGATLQTPFGATAPAPPPQSAAAFQALLPNLNDTLNGNYPSGNLFGPFLIGGYDANNKLPYTVNWTFDIQYQASNNWLFSAGYVGNHGVHEVLPIPFNQPLIATPQNPVNGQMYSYGGVTPLYLNQEPYDPAPEYAGNAPGRVPYVGYDMNSVLYEAEGISNYNALQLQARKRLANGLQFTASYTWSHALDEQSGLGLFFTGNNPLNPKSNYASADFDQTHVFLINYSYTLPNLTSDRSQGFLLNGWTIGGQTVVQSGEPYSIYDYSGSVASLYYGSSDYITNPIVPLVPGVSAKQAELQGTTGINASNPVLNAADFAPQFVTPGTNGVPPCDSSGCDYFESLYGNTGRNLFRAPFQVRFDMSIAKEFLFGERYRLRFNFDAFNLFNHPDFDAPNNDVDFFPYYEGPPSIPPTGSLGYIQHTIGSSRFLQLSLHLSF
ncbi:MAG: TonB-dependent receptor [Bryobacteraceae bacterium]|jgi:hypothetical protein